MRKWLTFVVTVAVAAAGLASSGANSAVGQAPKPDLIGKPGDLVRLAGSPWVFAVNEATPRDVKFRKQKVTTFIGWMTTPKGTPVPNGKVIFIWQWASQRKSLAGFTFWNPSATKILPPKEGQVFYAGGSWPARYARSPWAVTENQRLGRKARLLVIGRFDFLRVPTLKGPGFNAQIGCEYTTSKFGRSLDCWPVDYLSTSEEPIYGFNVVEPWAPENVIMLVSDSSCGCSRRVG